MPCYNYINILLNLHLAMRNMEKSDDLLTLSGCQEKKWIYWLLWVGFRYTEVENPDVSLWTTTSKNGILPVSSHSVENFMDGTNWFISLKNS